MFMTDRIEYEELALYHTRLPLRSLRMHFASFRQV